METGVDVYINDDVVIKHKHLTKIGSHVAIDKGFYCTTSLIVGDYVHISPYVTTIGGASSNVIIEDFCFVAAGSKLVAGSEIYSDDALIGATIPAKYRSLKLETVKFERFSGCGVNCSILPGVTLAQGSVIGANSVVTRDTEPWTVYAGSPAVPIKLRPHDKILQFARELGYNFN
jgi:acetyltransferase-like isoleucine patch superfamily enzyme